MNGTEPPKVQLCYSYYKNGGIENNTYVFDPNITNGESLILYWQSCKLRISLGVKALSCRSIWPLHPKLRGVFFCTYM